ncbi:MAG: hypothetical protein ACRC8M_00295 [Cetobacterium sp.]|uniref:hypothetical protein n=1 Tax=Cetobacterium sp. TaxID=2071632 RepID=UPI003F331711
MFLIETIKNSKNIRNKELAEILGTSYQFIHSLTKGEKKINKSHIDKIFNAIEFSEDEKEEILLEFYLEDAPSDFKEKIFNKIKKETI